METFKFTGTAVCEDDGSHLIAIDQPDRHSGRKLHMRLPDEIEELEEGERIEVTGALERIDGTQESVVLRVTRLGREGRVVYPTRLNLEDLFELEDWARED